MVDKSGMAYSKAAGLLYGFGGSPGNGAAMRAAPIGLFFYDSSDPYAETRASAVVTHTHPLGIDGAAAVVKAVVKNVVSDPQKGIVNAVP